MDTPETTHLSLCAGYGGIDLGLRRVLPDVRTIAYVEIEAFAVANLVAKMEAGELDPAPVWTNLKTLPLEVFRGSVSIISGGFPCQPFSAAGTRNADDDPRHLFPYIKNAISTIRPEWVFLENVEGIISAKLKSDGWADPAGTPVLLHVLRELERVGYRSTAGVFSAAEVGATHQRKRVFILGKKMGDPGCAGLQGHGVEHRLQESSRQGEAGGAGDGGGSLADTHSSRGFKDWITTELRTSGVEQPSSHRWPSRPGEAQQEWEEPRVVGDAEGRQIHGGKSGELGEAAQRGESEATTVADPSAELADAHRNESASIRGDDGEVPQVSAEQGQEHCAVVSGGEGEESSKRQTESQLGRATDGPPRGLDPTANRVDRLRLLGNGVVPQTAEVAFRTLYEELTR